MRNIKIWFTDFWPGFNPWVNPYVKMLTDPSIIVSNENPDIIFAVAQGGWIRGQDYKKFPRAVKVQVIHSEWYFSFNRSEFDYYIGSLGEIHSTDKSVYIPFWMIRNTEYGINADTLWNETGSRDSLLNRSFCSFIGLLRGRPFRKDFIAELSKYKPVTALGADRYISKLPNDTGFLSKINWCQGFKFNICFENGDKPGYITEKIIDPVFAKSLPIYYGNYETVKKDFDLDEDLIVRGNDFSRVIDRVRYLDTHDDAYLELLSRHILKDGIIDGYRNEFTSFVHKIVNDKNKESA